MLWASCLIFPMNSSIDYINVSLQHKHLCYLRSHMHTAGYITFLNVRNLLLNCKCLHINTTLNPDTTWLSCLWMNAVSLSLYNWSVSLRLGCLAVTVLHHIGCSASTWLQCVTMTAVSLCLQCIVMAVEHSMCLNVVVVCHHDCSVW